MTSRRAHRSAPCPTAIDRAGKRRCAADGAAREVLEHIRARVPLYTDLTQELARRRVRDARGASLRRAAK
jgi:hypothetical protein